LQQERTQQLLRGYRGTSRRGVQLAESRLQMAQGLIRHGPDRTQGMLLRNSLFGTYVAEHPQLLIVISTHAFFLSACTVDMGVVFQHPARSRFLDNETGGGFADHFVRDE